MKLPQLSVPSIFISSKIRDLIDVRFGIKFVLESQGYKVLLSEQSDFDVKGDRTAIDECLENIRASDFYVLVVDARRVGLYLDESTSITRKEFRTAIEQNLATGKPKIFAYVRKSTYDMVGRGPTEQNEARIDYPDHLVSFLRKIPPIPIICL